MPVYKDEARNTWYASFYYTDWQGIRKKKKKEGFKRRREALDFEKDFIQKASGNCDMLFKNMVDLYLEDKKVKLKITTCQNKEFIFKNKLIPAFGDRPLNTITPNDIRLWHNSLLAENNYKPTYLRKLNAQLSSLFNFAVKYYGLNKNPVTLCDNIGKGTANTMQFWTLEEFKKFLNYLRDDKILKMAFELLFWTGMRYGEMAALTWKDIDLENKKITISKSLARLHSEDIIQTPKTDKSRRTIDIPSFLCQDLEVYKSAFYSSDDTERAVPISNHAMYRAIDATSAKAEIKPIRIHDLRHSHASLLIELGFSPLAISERLGHEKVQTTMEIYGHLYPNKQEEICTKLEELYK